jgi:ribosomal protein L15
MININKIWTLIPEEQREKFLASKDVNNCPVVDVTQFGYFGVIARGYMPTAPIIIKARYFSQIAEEKIKEAKGACVLVK